MKIAVLGTGYVGLVTGVCLANTGKEVYCIDIDPEKIQMIKDGISPIYEPGLSDLLAQNRKRITPTTDAKSAILDADVVFIAVGTPFDGQQIDLKYIKNAATEIGEFFKEISPDKYPVVVVKSTVVPKTTMDIVRPIVLETSGKTEEDIGFCMNPEFLREGNAVSDFQNPDRIVLGVSSPKAETIMREVYNGFEDADIMVTNPTTAEMIKYTANSYLALTISYANEIARICEQLEHVDSEEVFKGVILDKRISPIVNNERVIPKLTTYLRAGCGFGGSCFPKDVKALASFEKIHQVDGALLNGLLEINDSQLDHIFRRALKAHNNKVKHIAVLGTAFKPDTDDIRESPGIRIIHKALERGMEVNVHDYIAMKNTEKVFNQQINYFDDPLEAIKNADIVFVTTIWDQYKKISDNDFSMNLKNDAIVMDCRSLYKNRVHQPWRLRVGINENKKLTIDHEY